ncbi:hypothetical protein LG202_06490 [Methylobacillus methanolivorans]
MMSGFVMDEVNFATKLHSMLDLINCATVLRIVGVTRYDVEEAKKKSGPCD